MAVSDKQINFLSAIKQRDDEEQVKMASLQANAKKEMEELYRRLEQQRQQRRLLPMNEDLLPIQPTGAPPIPRAEINWNCIHGLSQATPSSLTTNVSSTGSTKALSSTSPVLATRRLNQKDTSRMLSIMISLKGKQLRA